MADENAITLYLTEWQKRMGKDYVKSAARLRVNKIIISKIPKKEWVMYRQPNFEDVRLGAWSLYLTDEQISHVAEMTGVSTKIAALNISPEMIKSKVIVFA
jgi:hypothetical protein